MFFTRNANASSKEKVVDLGVQQVGAALKMTRMISNDKSTVVSEKHPFSAHLLNETADFVGTRNYTPLSVNSHDNSSTRSIGSMTLDVRLTEVSLSYVLSQLEEIHKATAQPRIINKCDECTTQQSVYNSNSIKHTTAAVNCSLNSGVKAIANVRAFQRILSRRSKAAIANLMFPPNNFFDVVSMNVASKFVAARHTLPLSVSTIMNSHKDLKLNGNAEAISSADVSPSSASTHVVDHWDVISSDTPPSNAQSPIRTASVMGVEGGNSRELGAMSFNASRGSKSSQMDVKLVPEILFPLSASSAISNFFNGGVCDTIDPLRAAERSMRRRQTRSYEELRAYLESCVRRSRGTDRRRKSMDDSALAMAAVHAHEMQCFREFQNPHSVIPAYGRGYMRSQSTFCVTEHLAGRNTQSVHKTNRVGKQNSLMPISPSMINDSWPASITSMLTCGQPIRDRLLLFCQIEKILSQFSKSRVESYDFSVSSECNYAPTDNSSVSTATSVNSSHNNSAFQLPRYAQQVSQLAGVNSTPCGSPSICSPVENNENLFRKRRTNGLRIVSGASSIPRPDKKWEGEDAYFLSDLADGFIGLADGVGEWCELGPNPRKFADELMEGAKRAADRLYSKSRKSGEEAHETKGSARAMRLLKEGYNLTKSFGSSTVLIAGLDSEGKSLGLTNLGDSALIVLRRESSRHRHFTVCRRTKEQQHFFNCPYQLSRVPTEEDVPELQKKGMYRLIKLLPNLQSNYQGDTPDMADLYDIKLKEGDLIIAATDGLLDNLFDREVANLVSLCLSPYEAELLDKTGLYTEDDCSSCSNGYSVILPEYHKTFGYATPPVNVARALAEAAFYRSMDPTIKTPFGVQSRRAGGFFSGGKMDDITVIAMWVV